MAGVLNLCFSIFKDFCCQRPFSGGCGGWFSEKSGKNLSQSYGRWIVGFHEANDQRLFCAQKGHRDWRLEMSEENISQKERYLREVEQKLLRKELDTELLEDGLLHVKWNSL